MERIEADAARMGKLVDELLLLARLDAELPPERTPVDLVEVASNGVRTQLTSGDAAGLWWADGGSVDVPLSALCGSSR